MRYSTPQAGFTLIELSIVLVIIGLIVGGVLVGQDLIKAAGIRATIQQIEKYNGAVNTFYGKYGGMPGDISQTQVAAFGFLSMAGTTGRGDNNGLVDGIIAGVSEQAAWTQEGCAFWVDLTDANLLDGNFNQTCDGASPQVVAAASTPTLVWPVARIQKGNLINVGSAGGLNYFMIGGYTQGTAGGAIYGTGNLTPIEAYSMDAKMDDGSPLTGLVQAHSGAANGATISSLTAFTDAPSATTTSETGYCLSGDSAGTAVTDTYNVNLTLGGATNACMVRFRFN
jgi:prepilin-type N-terminal cleavage/methylation domain-containing protein